MKVTIEHDKITHSIELDNDASKQQILTIFKRLMMCVGYCFNDDQARDVILHSNEIMGVK